MEKVNLRKYQVTLIASIIGTISLCMCVSLIHWCRHAQVTTVDDALAVLEENGDPVPHENSSGGGRGTASLERGLSLATKGSQAIQLSQKGKKDTLFFTLGVSLCFCSLLPSPLLSSPLLLRYCKDGYSEQID